MADQVPCDASRTDARAIVGRPRRWPRSIRPRSRALVVQLARNDTPHSIARVAGYRQLHVDGVGHRINLAGSDEIERLLRGFHHGIES